MTTASGPTPITLKDVGGEGPKITAIPAVWGALAAFGHYGIGDIGLSRPGHFFYVAGDALAVLFVVAGLASVLRYVIARGIQLSRS